MGLGKKLLTFACGLGLSLVGVANAGTILTTPVDYTFGPDQTNFADTITVAQFNPATVGFALHSVHIDLNGTATSGGPTGGVSCITGGTGGVCSGTLSSQVTITLTAPGGFNLAQVIPLTSFSYNISQGNSVQTPLLTDTKDSGTIIFNDPPDTALVSLFSGTGTVTLNLAGTGVLTTLSGNGFVFEGDPLFGNGTVTVSYDYLGPNGSVPEPATAALMGMVLIGLGLVVRKRRKD